MKNLLKKLFTKKSNKPLFDRRFIYPSDQYGGIYLDLEGEIISVDEFVVDVFTEYGKFTGYIDGNFGLEPVVGYKATIRVYDWGGGWYPDNRIISWTVKQ
jgi:hypothetical protein